MKIAMTLVNNVNGLIKSLGWEEGNIIHRVMRECFFYSGYTESSEWEKTIGFCNLGECDDAVTECFSEHSNCIHITFHGYNYINQEMLDEFVKYVKEFCKDEKDLMIIMNADYRETYNDYKPKLTLYFFDKK